MQGTNTIIILLEKLIGSQLVKKFPAFYGTRKFITAFTRARHLLCLYRKQSKLVNVYVAKAYGRVKVKVKVKLEAFLDSY